MAKKKLGNKHVCYQCNCKFYDLSRPKPICPKCGADQTEAPKKDPPKVTFTGQDLDAEVKVGARTVRYVDGKIVFGGGQ